MIKPWIKHTWICSPWCVHRWDKWWSPIRWPMMLSWSWWWRTPFSFAFQLIALFFYRYLLVFIQKLLKGRFDPIFCITRLPRFRPVMSEPIWLLLSCLLAELEHCSATSFEVWSPLGTIWAMELADVSSTVGFSLSCVKSEFLFNHPFFLHDRLAWSPCVSFSAQTDLFEQNGHYW